jgi:hypothetical protein
MSIEKAVELTVQNEVKKREKSDDFLEKQRLLAKMKDSGFLMSQSYNIAPLDTIGKRRFQSNKK